MGVRKLQFLEAWIKNCLLRSIKEAGLRHWLLHSQFDWTAQSRHNMEVHVTGQQMTQEKKGGRLNHDHGCKEWGDFNI